MKLLVILLLIVVLLVLFRKKIQAFYNSMFPNLNPAVRDIIWFCMCLFPFVLLGYLAVVFDWIAF